MQPLINSHNCTIIHVQCSKMKYFVIIIDFNSKVSGSDNKIGQSASTAVATSKVSQFNDFLRQHWI